MDNDNKGIYNLLDEYQDLCTCKLVGNMENIRHDSELEIDPDSIFRQHNYDIRLYISNDDSHCI